MAQKRKNSAETAPAPKGAEARKLIIGLFFTVLSVYTFIALISYLFTWAQDQSLLSHPDVWNTLVSVENGGGKIGFFWANFLLSQLFGLGAFIFPFYFAAIAIYSLKIKKLKLVRITYISIYGAIILSLLFSFIFGFTKFEDWFGNGVGGSYGYYVNQWLIAMLGVAGTGSIIFVAFIIWLILLNHNIAHWINRGIQSIFRRKPKATKITTTANDIPNKETVTNPSTDPIVVTTTTTESTKAHEKEVPFEIEEIESKPSSDNVQDESNGDGPELLVEEIEEDPDFLKDIPKGSLETMFDPRLDLPRYKAPGIDLLDDYKNKIYKVPFEELERNNKKIVKTLGDYKISIEKIFARTGPTVTLYEIVPSPGVRISQIKRLEDDIALSLAARGVRIIAPIPGTNAVGIEVANSKPSIVPMKSLLNDPKFLNSNFELPIILGRTISNEPMMFDLAKMPHLLVAGATGQGKSVGLNVIITSLLYTKHPSEMKMVLIDPKKVELSLYSKIEKHFLAKLPDSEDAIITDTQKVIYTLKSLTIEMDTRYDLLKLAHVRTVKEYNEKFLSRKLNPLKGHKFMHFIVVIIDEFADLLMTAGHEIEEPIVRLAQLARAIGIHLVIATQRPTTNIITGLIKANFPARIAFRVISNIDSRTILETTGANQLVGRGDMLISISGEITRVQCALVDTAEVERITEFIGNQQGYATAHFLPEYTGEDGDSSGIGDVDLGKRDKLFEEAAKLIVQFQQGSTSLIQRRMNLGYNRAGRIMDQLEAAGIVGPSEGSKARQVLITDFISLDKILNSLD